MWHGIMLICFGASWPMAIVKTIRVKNPKGKSFIFMTLVLIGYICGLMGHVSASGKNCLSDWVFWLYIVDFAMVATDLTLSLYYANRLKHLDTPLAE